VSIVVRAEERRQVVTLPPTIAKLTNVRNLVLYGSNLVRIPPEIGAMRSLEEFTPYTSYRLHWLPYEVTRCRNLRRSTVSTRALFGNHKYRPPFPTLPSSTADGTGGQPDLAGVDPGKWGATTIRSCSVCSRPLDRACLRQVWISLRVATDVLPLLVNACSSECIQALAQPPQDYIRTPHRGGPVIGSTGADSARRPWLRWG